MKWDRIYIAASAALVTIVGSIAGAAPASAASSSTNLKYGQCYSISYKGKVNKLTGFWLNCAGRKPIWINQKGLKPNVARTAKGLTYIVVPQYDGSLEIRAFYGPWRKEGKGLVSRSVVIRDTDERWSTKM